MKHSIPTLKTDAELVDAGMELRHRQWVMFCKIFRSESDADIRAILWNITRGTYFSDLGNEAKCLQEAERLRRTFSACRTEFQPYDPKDHSPKL
jgi:hypothetical protein